MSTLIRPAQRSALGFCSQQSSTGEVAVRLGLATVRGIGTELAEQIIADRTTCGLYPNLAAAGVFDGLVLSRRDALWTAGAAARERPHLPGLTVPAVAPPLPGTSLLEIIKARSRCPPQRRHRILRVYLDSFGPAWLVRTGRATGRRPGCR